MFSSSDIANFPACRHIATLDRAEERKEVTKPFFNDPTIDLLRKPDFCLSSSIVQETHSCKVPEDTAYPPHARIVMRESLGCV